MLHSRSSFLPFSTDQGRTLRLYHNPRIAIKHGWLVAARYLVSSGTNKNGRYDMQGVYAGTDVDAAV